MARPSPSMVTMLIAKVDTSVVSEITRRAVNAPRIATPPMASGSSQMAILTDYRGLRVSDLQNLRGRLRGVGVEYAVAKNTLTRFAAERVGREAMVQDLTGPTAIAFVYDDPSAATRAIQDFIRATRSPLKIKGGVLG